MLTDIILLAVIVTAYLAGARIAGRPVPDDGRALLRGIKTMQALLFIEGLAIGAVLCRFAEAVWRCL